jgi:hypothetical protein
MSEAKIDEFPRIYPASRKFPVSETGSLETASSMGEMLWGGRRGWQFRRLHQSMEWHDAPAERFEQSLVALDQDSTIIAVVEMSQSSWLVGGVLPALSVSRARSWSRTLSV